MKTDEQYNVIESGEAAKKSNKSSVVNSNSNPMHPRFCINCGYALDAGDRFCTECGTKVESEVSEAKVIELKDIPEHKSSTDAVRISRDRMASIAETTSRILEAQTNIFQKSDSPRQLQEEQKKKIPSGIYVYKLTFQTMYLKIESVIGNSIRVRVRTEFANGTYGIENYDGTLCGNGISLHLSDYDLHTQYSFKLGESFLGFINDDTISGNFCGEFSGFCIFKKIN